MNIRLERANSDIMRVLSTAMRQRDQFDGVTILKVDTSADFAWCNVSVDIPGDNETKQMTIRALADAAGFFRKEVSSSVQLRTTPQIRFILDKGRENANRVEELLAQINASKE